MGASELKGGSFWGVPHNFISIEAPGGHNPTLVMTYVYDYEHINSVKNKDETELSKSVF
jgi:hypothetical protein